MFITYEGIEGSGKSTVMHAVRDALLQAGHGVTLTREPGGSRLGQTLRAMLLDSKNTDIAPQTELFLYLADRAQHVHQVVKPALAENIIVLSDRYADSTVVYQGYGRGLDPSQLHAFNDVAVDGLWPDLTLLFDLDAEVGLRRALVRNMQEQKHVTEGRFEAEDISFHQRVRQGYLTWAAIHKERFVVIDAGRELEAVKQEAVDVVMRRVGQ